MGATVPDRHLAEGITEDDAGSFRARSMTCRKVRHEPAGMMPSGSLLRGIASGP